MLNKMKSTSGFSLTEVMIGIMILTVAIVSASSLLVSLVKTNRLNVQTLQAYYFAQEGVEGVRNIRDTNWLHNLDFKGGEVEKVYHPLEVGKVYSLSLMESGWIESRLGKFNLNDVKNMKPWKFDAVNDTANFFNDRYALAKDSDGYYTEKADDAVFYRHIEILDACDNDPVLKESFELEPDKCGDFILVKSVVNWMDGPTPREISLEEVLSNWKGGAL